MQKREIVPTILTKDRFELQQKLASAQGIVPRIQIDVVDGIFSEGRSFNLEDLKALDHDFRLDLHLMVAEPVDWVPCGREVGAEMVVAQVEMMSDPDGFVRAVTGAGMKAGLALNSGTPVERISPKTYLKLEAVLLMGYPAGFKGGKFQDQVLGKIKKSRALVGERAEVMVDGGLDQKNIVKCKEAGANVFCLGKAFWEAKDLASGYQELTELVNS